STLYQYGYAMDYGPDGDFVDCFTPDGVWDVRKRTAPDTSFQCRGHGEIQRSLDGQPANRVPTVYVKHIVVDARIVVIADSATVESYFLRVEPRDDKPTQIVASGRYLDRMVRCDDARWRFVERVAEIDDL